MAGLCVIVSSMGRAVWLSLDLWCGLLTDPHWHLPCREINKAGLPGLYECILETSGPEIRHIMEVSWGCLGGPGASASQHSSSECKLPLPLLLWAGVCVPAS